MINNKKHVAAHFTDELRELAIDQQVLHVAPEMWSNVVRKLIRSRELTLEEIRSFGFRVTGVRFDYAQDWTPVKNLLKNLADAKAATRFGWYMNSLWVFTAETKEVMIGHAAQAASIGYTAILRYGYKKDELIVVNGKPGKKLIPILWDDRKVKSFDVVQFVSHGENTTEHVVVPNVTDVLAELKRLESMMRPIIVPTRSYGKKATTSLVRYSVLGSGVVFQPLQAAVKLLAKSGRKEFNTNVFSKK